MTLHRWIFVIVALLLLLGTAIGLYFREIQLSRWTAESAAEQRAMDEAGVTVIDETYHHVWHQDAWIVQGLNVDDEEIFVWLTEETEPYVMKAEEGVSQEEIKNKLQAEYPEAAIVHIQPGLFDKKPVWEVFYHTGSNQQRYFYQFYSFDSGEFIERYHLPARKEP